MSHRRKTKSQRLERERQEHRLVNRIRRHKGAFVFLVCVVVLVVLGALTMHGASPNYNACGSGSAQQLHFWLFIQIGDAVELNTKTLTIPDPQGASDLGITPTCKFPLHVDDGPGSRGPYYTRVHLESLYPVSEHIYTLGDLFATWGYWLAHYDQSLPYRPLYFGPGGVSYYRGSVEVRVAFGEDYQSYYPWNYTSASVGTGYVLQDQAFVHVILHDPYQTTDNAH